MLSHKLESESLDDSKGSGGRLTDLDVSNVTQGNETMTQLCLHGWRTTEVTMLEGTGGIKTSLLVCFRAARATQRGDTQL